MSLLRGVVFDGDDTLWFAEQLYDAARSRAAAIAAEAGLNPADWTALQLELDVENVARFGLSAKRFPTSCVEAYQRLAPHPIASVERAIWDAAASVFEVEAPLADGAEQALRDLGARFRLGLLTKGDPEVQQRRIARSGLGPRFESVVIVANKGEATFRAMAESLRLEPEEVCSVGNSLASDINPALRVGMSAIWIDAHVWAHERRETVPNEGHLTIAKTLRAAASILLAASTPQRDG